MRQLLIVLMIIFLIGCGHARPWTSDEKILLLASCLAGVADYYTTKRLLDEPGTRELNPIIYGRPKNRTLIIFFISTQTITTILADSFPKWRKTLLGGKCLINTSLAINNYEKRKDLTNSY